MTKTPIPTENSKTNGQHKNATKNLQDQDKSSDIMQQPHFGDRK